MLFVNLYQNISLQHVVFMLGTLGFCAAVLFGSIAWYSSRRLVGWKDKRRPDYVPKLH